MHENYFLPVNWVDGMKINKSHFIAESNALAYQLAQNTSCMLHELNYGLLPVSASGGSVKLFVSTDNQRKIQVRVQQCRAITAGGYYIEFNEDTKIQGAVLPQVLSEPVGLKEIRDKAVEFYIVLTINPFARLPHGMVDMAEIPPRLPFTVPTIVVDLIPVSEVAGNILGGYQLPVGKMSIEDQRVFIEEDYIPPCTSIISHPGLLEIHAGLEQFYAKMELYALQIVQKIIQKKQVNDMAGIVHKISDYLLSFTASRLAELKSAGVVQAPVYMITGIASLSRGIKNIIDCYLGTGKEELINYFTEWCNISQGELERIIIDLANHQYDHLDINRSIDKVTEFTRIISGLFHKLSRIEYIGKRKEAGIFVKEEAVNQPDNPVQKRRSFLAD
ncbi:MAG: hypothetical protein ABIN36_12305 [Ferruginibacter sp.]